VARRYEVDAITQILPLAEAVRRTTVMKEPYLLFIDFIQCRL